MEEKKSLDEWVKIFEKISLEDIPAQETQEERNARLAKLTPKERAKAIDKAKRDKKEKEKEARKKARKKEREKRKTNKIKNKKVVSKNAGYLETRGSK